MCKVYAYMRMGACDVVGEEAEAEEGKGARARRVRESIGRNKQRLTTEQAKRR